MPPACACRLDSTLAEQRVLDTLVAKYRGEVERLQRQCAQAEDQVVHLRDQLQVRCRGTQFGRATTASCTGSLRAISSPASPTVLLYCS